MMDQKLGKKQILIGVVFALVLLPVVGLTVFLFTKPQNTTPKAASGTQAAPSTIPTSTQANSGSANTAQAVCTAPNQVTNVKVNYPNCQ